MQCSSSSPSAVLLTLVILVCTTEARPDGQPWPDSCQSLSPGNDVPPQTGPCPYELIVDDHQTFCDSLIYVTIKGSETEEFAGFMLQARTKEGKAIGKFLPADDVKTMDCFGDTENTAININYLPKEEIITKWRPEGFMGNVTIYASVAKDYMEQIYWLNLKTKPIKCTKAKYT